MVELADKLHSIGERAVLSTLFSVHGSSYKPLGSMMVSGYGSAYRAGGISGGCLEKYVAQQGWQLTTHVPATMLSLSTGLDRDEGNPQTGCGGTIEILCESIRFEHYSFLHQYYSAHESDEPTIASCLISETNGEVQSVQRNLGDANTLSVLKRPFHQLAYQTMERKQSKVYSLPNSCRALCEYIQPMTRLVIFGARDDAIPLCRLAHDLDWHVTVADCRAGLATITRFPEANHLITSDWWHALQLISFNQQTVVVIMTHSFPDDVELLSLLADKCCRYVGVLGPVKRKQQLIREAGTIKPLPYELLEKLHGPVGFDLGDRSATGIAVSIVSEILAVMNDKISDPVLEMNSFPIDHHRFELSASHA
ncbi:MAG: XdhC family protein [Gemmatales bacterium]